MRALTQTAEKLTARVRQAMSARCYSLESRDMSKAHASAGRLSRAAQRGGALLFALLLIMIGASVFSINTSMETARFVQAETRAVMALGAAKEALVTWAAAHPTRPGAFPCPDTDNDGRADTLLPGGDCPGYLGRLPWHTLGVGDLYDSAGERLWYALSPNWRNFPAINSDTKGNRIVYSGSTTVEQTREAVAVVFAPGAVLPGQQRGTDVAPCASTGTALPRTRCASNYLDRLGATDNAQAAGPFITAPDTPGFNDQVGVIRASDVVPLMERRVASDLRRALVQYRERSREAILGGGCNCYPWADSDRNGSSNVGHNRGAVPLTASPHNWGATLSAGGVAYVLPTLPAYVQPNNWHRIIFYAVGRNALANFGASCTTCTGDPLLPPPVLLKGTLSLDKDIGLALVLITPGSAGPNRPPVPFNWGEYIDDGMNRDGDDRFVTPAARTYDRDRIFTMPDDVPPQACSSNAKMLVHHAPCHTTGTSVKPVCARAERNLNLGCSCSGDATVMVTEPCRNTLSPGECQAAASNLLSCSN